MMLPFRDEAVIVSSRTGSSNLWFYLSIEFIIGAIISGFLIILGLVKSFLPKRPRDLTGDVVLIAGASSTLGASLVEEFAKNGCSVICIDNDLRFVEEITRRLKLQSNKIELTCNKVEEIGLNYRKYRSENTESTIAAYKCDLLNRNAIRKIAKKVEDEVGGIDVLVTCVGQSNRDIFDVASTTLMSHYWTMLAFLPSLLRRDRAHIIGITPVASNQDAYSSSRVAIAGLMESLGQELSNHNNNLTFLAISPMVMRSNLIRQKEQEVAKEVIQAVSMGSQEYSFIIVWCLKLYKICCGICNALIACYTVPFHTRG
ncbi:short-chain dehydrogenase/reductase family 16C member 6-like [Linepithema humile]|uniref:short-chain dehydrogenase/reductase family 16C member 6-like n=1 Tax=Linepithema humile TaxID=83485 RepID=UPI0006237381|nr:PREDICTED: short-chain dehydrogenase/reductase family 16C member 6-like [Linepithema humile]XP_012219804.1 PREDICTED: short-chain dehydrogenase/reductase family 16C member 6-like [Linepithema humile]XP_012219805.1 PREDICTED: short-chain dehydrogenase/reductase family 16C member 6-like [Linepithema humile]XP_012219806.1 PREDICTED: short-chain dehydrogenase/reductase family 16C member 6-like [Linepithema humile]